MDWKPLLKTFASILFGFALAMLSRPCGPPGPPHFGKHAPPGGKGFVEQFAADFSLTPDQKAQAEKIFQEQREKAETLHKEVFPKFDGIRAETRTRVRALLNATQQAKFDEVHEEMESFRRGRHHPGAPDKGQPPYDHGPPGEERPGPPPDEPPPPM